MTTFPPLLSMPSSPVWPVAGEIPAPTPPPPGAELSTHGQLAVRSLAVVLSSGGAMIPSSGAVLTGGRGILTTSITAQAAGAVVVGRSATLTTAAGSVPWYKRIWIWFRGRR